MDQPADSTEGTARTPQRQQSFFFVKNDPVVQIVCGSRQSGVICESGRLFVWGYGQHGQLGLGKTETIHKPSCVRAIKRLKERVQSFCFGGNGFSIVLSGSGRLYYSGKNIFPFNAKVSSLREATTMQKNVTDNSEFTALPIELREFSECLEKEDEQFVEVVAGFCHFIARTSAGNCYGWGHNSHQQLGGVDSLKILTKPDRLGLEEKVELVCCGHYCTLMVTETNGIYLVGKFQKISIPVIKQLAASQPLPGKILAVAITGWDCIYLLLQDRRVYCSNRVSKIDELRFARYEKLDGVLRENECVTKIASANDFTSFTTNKGRLLTTYDDECPFTSSEHYRELGKFENFRVTDIASGTEHSLVLAFPVSDREDTPHSKHVQCGTLTIEDCVPRIGTPLPPDAEKTIDFIRSEKLRLRREHVEKEISKDECMTIETGESEVRFIDNGHELTGTTRDDNSHQSSEQRMNERNHQNLLAPQRDQETFSAHRDRLEVDGGQRKTLTPNISQLIDYSDDDNGSISSQSTFNDEEEEPSERYVPKVDRNGTGKGDSNNNLNHRKLSLASKLDGSTDSTKSSGKMRRFFKELKAKSMDVTCKNAGTVLDDDIKYSKNDHEIRAEDRASKVCTVM